MKSEITRHQLDTVVHGSFTIPDPDLSPYTAGMFGVYHMATYSALKLRTVQKCPFSEACDVRCPFIYPPFHSQNLPLRRDD